MIYDEALFNFSQTYGIEFLAWRTWIGVWNLVIGLLMATFEGSIVVKFFTTFTKEIFAALISTIFIWESGKNITMFLKFSRKE
jgi:hypothetical protein